MDSCLNQHLGPTSLLLKRIRIRPITFWQVLNLSRSSCRAQLKTTLGWNLKSGALECTPDLHFPEKKKPETISIKIMCCFNVLVSHAAYVRMMKRTICQFEFREHTFMKKLLYIFFLNWPKWESALSGWTKQIWPPQHKCLASNWWI